MAKKLYGTDPDQVPTNADLGTMAYQDDGNVNVGTINTTGDVGINTTSRMTDLTIAHNGHGLGLGYEGATLPALAGLYTSNSTNYGQAYGSLVVQSRTDYSGYSIIFRNNGGEAARFTQSGNLAFPNGQGIDFSATSNGSGTMTSELLDDYEEGTWVPTYQTSGTGFSGITYDTPTGTYTKVGKLVHIQAFISTDNIVKGDASGNIQIGNLPFTPASNAVGIDGFAAITLSTSQDFLGENPQILQVTAGNPHGELRYRATSTGPLLALQVSDMGTTTNDNVIYFSGTYLAS